MVAGARRLLNLSEQDKLVAGTRKLLNLSEQDKMVAGGRNRLTLLFQSIDILAPAPSIEEGPQP